MVPSSIYDFFWHRALLGNGVFVLAEGYKVIP